MKWLLIPVLALGLNAFAAENDSAQVPGQDFAAYLQENGEYYRAITEYLRLLHEHPQSSRQVAWRSDILACYQAADQIDDALLWASRWIPPGQSYSREEAPSVLYPVGIALEAGHYDFVLGTRSRQIRMLDSADSDRLQRGYAIALAASGENPAVDSMLGAHPYWSPDFRGDLVAATHVPQKSPAWGRLFSFFPGGGYLYAGKTGTAAASLVIISLLSYGMYESIHYHQDALAIGMGIFNFAWYTGSIYVSASLVDDWNAHEKRAFAVKLNQYF